METVLQIHSIEKSYGPVKALKGVSFKVPKGSVFGVLGPNGSGKTTMLGILLDVLKADAGTYHWENYQDAAAARKQIGSLLETPTSIITCLRMTILKSQRRLKNVASMTSTMF